MTLMGLQLFEKHRDSKDKDKKLLLNRLLDIISKSETRLFGCSVRIFFSESPVFVLCFPLWVDRMLSPQLPSQSVLAMQLCWPRLIWAFGLDKSPQSTTSLQRDRILDLLLKP